MNRLVISGNRLSLTDLKGLTDSYSENKHKLGVTAEESCVNTVCFAFSDNYE